MFKLGCLVILLLATALGASGNEEADDRVIIDLQELLHGVSTTLKAVQGKLTICEGNKQEVIKSKDCSDIFLAGNRKSGIYQIWDAFGSFDVLCDMETDGGGWTVIQKRGDFGLPNDYFLKKWNNYKKGFGDLSKEFWMGNDHIYRLTQRDSYELRLDMVDVDNQTAYAKYSKFWIENENLLYKIQVGGYTGTAGDSLTAHNGRSFTTIDRHNDGHSQNCAEQFSGAWWYYNCHVSNLNGLNLKGTHASFANGINWHTWKGYNYSLASVTMKIRPRDYGI